MSIQILLIKSSDSLFEKLHGLSKTMSADKILDDKASFPAGPIVLTLHSIKSFSFFLANFEHFSHMAFVFLLLTLNCPKSKKLGS